MASKYGPHVERLRAVAGSLSGRLVALGGEREAQDGSEVHVLQLSNSDPVLSAAVPGATCALCWLADDLLLAGTGAGALLGWDASGAEGGSDKDKDKGPARADKPLLSLTPHTGALRALAADATGTRLASAGDDGVLRLFELEVKRGKPTLAERSSHTLSPRPLRAVAIDPAGATAAAAGDEGIVRVVPLTNASAGEVREMPLSCEGGVGALAYTGDGRLVAGCGDGTIRVCYLEGAIDEEERARDAAHDGAVRGLVFGPQLHDAAEQPIPRRLFSLGQDAVLKSWLLDSRRKPRSVELGARPCFDLAWLAAPSRAKPERRGGTLAVVDNKRQLQLLTLDERSEAGAVKKVPSELERLEQDLRARKQQVREAAVRALGALPEDEARVLLDRALAGDKLPEVRALAAAEIGRSGRRLSRPALRSALDDDDKAARAAALEALTAIEAQAPLAPVRAALGSSHPDMRKAAVTRLPGLRKASPLVPALIAGALRDRSPEVRAAALEALHVLEAPDWIGPARTALGRGPADVRTEVILRLGRELRLTDPDGAALVEGALDDADAAVRGYAFLVAVGARPTLAARLKRVDPHTAKALVDLEKKGPLCAGEPKGALTDEDCSPLFAAMACRTADTALRGARCLALLGDPRAAGALLQLSREATVEVRRAVVEALYSAALAMPADDRLVARLQWLLDDPDATTRSWAFNSLQKLRQPDGPRGALELCELSLRCAHEDIRVRALQILVQFGGGGEAAGNAERSARAGELLGDAMDDEAEPVRAEAFRTLWAWHSKEPQVPLRRGVQCRHADIRQRVVSELERQKGEWADALLLELVGDTSAAVGQAAYRALTDEEKHKQRAKAQRKRAEVHLAAMGSPRPEVRAAGCKGAARWAEAKAVRGRLVQLVQDERPAVHVAAIEAVDRLLPEDQEAFSLAFDSIFYNLRVRAAELCGKRRDVRAVSPMKTLLAIPEAHLNRPDDALRQRAARALADVGDPESIPLYVSLLDDDDSVVREMGGRGLATACRPKEEQPLVDALAHGDLAVRSWAAEGLARLGDARALPVLAGTLKHDHPPIRKGSILSLVALGPDGIRGVLQGLEDPDRQIQDLVFAVIAARDVALARKGVAPDLLLSALASSHPEIRFAAARVLETREGARVLEAREGAGPAAPPRAGAVATKTTELHPLLQELVGPRKPERASDMKEWPAAEERPGLLNVLINALAGDHPALRYAAAQVLALAPQPLSFWREVKQLAGPTAGDRPWIPHTNYVEDEAHQPRKRGWIRRLFVQERAAPAAASATERVLTVLKFVGAAEGRAVPPEAVTFDDEAIIKLTFGTYAGLARQAPAEGEADETHRVRRDSIERLGQLCPEAAVGREAVLPVLRRAISDPHHLVRKAAVTALRSLYPPRSMEPLGLALQSSAADVGRAAVDELIAAAQEGHEAARALCLEAINAPNGEVRGFALGRLPRLFDEGSPEPWLLALGSRHPDVRLAVVDRLIDSRDARVDEALGLAMESDHEDLRLKAAVAMARRGDPRTVDVLAAFLRAEEGRAAHTALEALVALVHARPQDAAATDAAGSAAATAVAARLEDDPDKTADRPALIDALERIGHQAAEGALLALMEDEEADLRRKALDALVVIARHKTAAVWVSPDGVRRQRYDEPAVLRTLEHAATRPDVGLRRRATEVLRDVDDAGAEALLGRLVEDREEEVRVAACEALAFRTEHVEAATVEPLVGALRGGRRELVLPAAAGMASRGRPEAFGALMLVFKAGEGTDRERAVEALGKLGDRRALEELEPLLDPKAELPDEDRALAPVAALALGAMIPRLEIEEERHRVRETVERLAREGAPAVRLQALSGLRLAGDDRSRALLEQVAGDRYEVTAQRKQAIQELGRLGHEASEAALAEALNTPDQSLRSAALAALRRIIPDDRTRTSLLALGSRFDDISQPAAAFLARRGDPAALVERLTEIKSEPVRRRLRQGLVRRGACPERALEQLLQGDAPAASRAEAAWIAGAAGTEALAAPLVAAVSLSAQGWQQARSEQRREALSAEERSWQACLWAATQVGAEVGDAARQAAADRDAPPSVRREALRYLGRRGSAKDLAVLQPSLTDPDAGVRAVAAAAITTLAPERAAEVIGAVTVADAAAMLPLVQVALPTAAGELLGTETGRRLALPVVLGGDRAEALVTIASARGKDPARLVAIASLGRMGGEAAQQCLEAILAGEGEDDAVRAVTFRALRRLQRAAEVRWEEGQDKESGRFSGGGYGGSSYDDDDDDDDDFDDDDDDDDDDFDDDDDDSGDDDDGGGDDDDGGGGGGAVSGACDLVLTACGDRKIMVIKVVRELTGVGLKEAKDLVEAAPSTVMAGIDPDQAEAWMHQLQEAGAEAELRTAGEGPAGGPSGGGGGKKEEDWEDEY